MWSLQTVDIFLCLSFSSVIVVWCTISYFVVLLSLYVFVWCVGNMSFMEYIEEQVYEETKQQQHGFEEGKFSLVIPVDT